MDNSLIKKHNFEEAKNKIQCFSNNIPKYVYFDKVDVEGGLFGWGDHKVTGTEMNRFIGKVQDRLMSVNTKLCSIIREFREVYNALDYLDKDYIQGIIISVEASEKASEKALKAQEDIRRTIEGLRQTVNALYNLKEDVDEIKSKLNSLDSLSVSLEKHITYVDYVYKEIDKHYNDIDSIRHDVEKGKVDLSNLQQQIDTFIAKTEVENQRIEESISSLQDYCSTLESLVHLKDIDSIWHNVEKGKVDISNLWNDELDTELGNIVTFPGNITTNSTIDEIKETYKTGIINPSMREWSEEIGYGEEAYESSGISYSGDRYDISIECKEERVTSIFYYYYK